MNSRVISKSLAAQEDLLFGESLVSQKRAGGNYVVTGIRMSYPVNNTTELNSLDAAQFPKASLYANGRKVEYFWTGTQYLEVINTNITRLNGYASTNLPDAAEFEQCSISITDNDFKPAYSDGTNWKYFSDDSMV